MSELGDRVSELPIPLIAITVLHVSPTTVGLLTAAVWAPNLLSIFVGAWVDQQASKRRLLVAANAVQALTIASLPVAHLVGGVTLAHLFVVAVVNGFAGDLTAGQWRSAHLDARAA